MFYCVGFRFILPVPLTFDSSRHIPFISLPLGYLSHPPSLRSVHLAKKSNQKKATPTSPNSRKSSLSDGWRRTRPALLFLIWFFVSVAQTPSPLIRPTGSILGGAVRGESKTRTAMTAQPESACWAKKPNNSSDYQSMPTISSRPAKTLRRPAHRQAVDPQRRLSHADRHALAFLAAGADA